MTHPQKNFAAKTALGVLTLFELLSIYQVLFCAWMTAQPLYDSPEWRTRFYVRLTTAIVIGALWFLVVIWMLRNRKAVRVRSA